MQWRRTMNFSRGALITEDRLVQLYSNMATCCSAWYPTTCACRGWAWSNAKMLWCLCPRHTLENSVFIFSFKSIRFLMTLQHRILCQNKTVYEIIH